MRRLSDSVRCKGGPVRIAHTLPSRDGVRRAEAVRVIFVDGAIDSTARGDAYDAMAHAGRRRVRDAPLGGRADRAIGDAPGIG